MQDTEVSISGIKDRIRDYILGNLLPDDSQTLDDDEDLLSRLDSLQILRMLVELETTYQFKVANSELTAENLGSVNQLSSFVARKL